MDEGTHLQEVDASSWAREWQAARAEAAGEGSPPWRGLLGEQMGQKMAADGGGACATTSSIILTHTLASGQSQGLKIATTSS